MTFNFTPKSDEELTMSKLLPEGEYPFIIKSATEKISKSSGNEMVELVAEVFGPDGGSVIVYDYLVLTDKMAWKLKHFYLSLSMKTQYNAGVLNAPQFVDKKGKASVTIEKQADKAPRNRIKDYISAQKSTPSAGTSAPPLNPNEPLELLDEDAPLF